VFLDSFWRLGAQMLRTPVGVFVLGDSVRLLWNALIVVGAVLPLAGCLSDQRQALEDCTVAAGKVEACMEQRGYVADFGSVDCLPIADKAASPLCYRPRGWFAGLGLRFEILFQSPPPPP
jgi:hypothetical protein